MRHRIAIEGSPTLRLTPAEERRILRKALLRLAIGGLAWIVFASWLG